jgi:hypothetical protein
MFRKEPSFEPLQTFRLSGTTDISILSRDSDEYPDGTPVRCVPVQRSLFGTFYLKLSAPPSRPILEAGVDSPGGPLRNHRGRQCRARPRRPSPSDSEPSESGALPRAATCHRRDPGKLSLRRAVY